MNLILLKTSNFICGLFAQKLLHLCQGLSLQYLLINQLFYHHVRHNFQVGHVSTKVSARCNLTPGKGMEG